MKIKKFTLAHGAPHASPLHSALDVVRDLIGKGVSLKRAIREGEKLKGLPMTSKELKDAENLTKHKPVVYIKPRVEPNAEDAK